MNAQYLGIAHSDSFWDLYSRVYGGVYQLIPYRNLLWDAYEALELEEGMRVLDAGCGTGNLEHFISTKPLPQIVVDGVDGSPGMLAMASRRCQDLGFVRFSLVDLNEQLPFDDNTFDRVVSINVLYALDRQEYAVREMLRVLKPEGRLVVSSPLPTYRVSPMVVDHLRRIKNVWGFRRRAIRMAESLWVLMTNGLVQWVLNDLIIDSRESEGLYKSLTEVDLEALLRKELTGNVGDLAVRLASANQNAFATAKKAVAA